MVKVLAPDVFRQHFDNSGDVLNGGLIYTYEGGTSTPATTWTDSAGGTAQANPIVLDSVGREPGGIWITKGTAYKFILKTAAGVTLDTVDNIVVGEVAAEVADQYEVNLSFSGTPTAQQWMGGVELCRTVTFDVDFDGSRGSLITNPASDFVISVQKNGAEVGTITIDDAGAYTFATTGGATVACIAGDTIDFYGPDTIGTAANIKATLVGTL